MSVAALAAAVGIGAIGQAGAASFQVTNTSASGAGSLAQAITDANNAGGADTIGFAPGLTGTITPAGGLTVTGPTTVAGPGAGVVTVSSRFEIAPTATATISGLTIDGGTLTGGEGTPGSATGEAGGDGDGGAGGVATGGNGIGGPADGGAIDNRGDLVIDRVVVTGGRGIGGIAGPVSGTGGRGGNAGGAPGQHGGPGGSGTSGSGAAGDVRGVGIFNAGTMTVRASTVSGNSATASDGGDATATGGDGGFGIAFAGGPAVGGPGGEGRATGARGGDALGVGIFNAGTMTIEASTITNNTATAGNGGDATAKGGNGSSGGTAGLGGAGGAATAIGGRGGDVRGAGIFNAGTLELRTSTVFGNRVVGGAPGSPSATDGSNGAFNMGGRATATAGAAGLGFGAGVDSEPAAGASASLRSVTLASNSGSIGANLRSTGTLTVVNSIMSNPLGGPNCAGTVSSGGFNLDSGTSCGLAQPGDQQSADPQLGLLQDNGGPTATSAPAQTSPAIDGGIGGGLTTDQRGLPRPSDFAAFTNAPGGDGSDIGAVELVAPPPPPNEALPFTVEVTAAKKQKGTKLRATITCSKACESDALGKGKAGGDRFKTKVTSLSLASGTPTAVKLKLKKGDRGDVAGEKGKATIAVTATAGSETAADSSKVKLKP
jgi:hypothetical protein